MEDGRAGTRWPDFCQAGETLAVAWMGAGQALGRWLARLAEVRLMLGAW
jgi:hypothetical protein